MVDRQCPTVSYRFRSRKLVKLGYKDLLVSTIKVMVENKGMIKVFLEQMYVSLKPKNYMKL